MSFKALRVSCVPQLNVRRNLFALCALMIHSQVKTAVSRWLVPTQVTQGDFCLSCGAAQLSFWGNSCKEVKCERSVAWLLRQDWSEGIAALGESVSAEGMWVNQRALPRMSGLEVTFMQRKR